MPIVSGGGGGGGTPFNGGTITGALVVAPVGTDAPAITGRAPDSGDDALALKDHLGAVIAEVSDGSLFDFLGRPADKGRFRIGMPDIALHIRTDPIGTAAQLGLFGATPAAQPALVSGTATPEQIALALQSYGAAGGT